MKAKDGKLYAEVTLRDVVENYDVSDLPMLTEIKRLYAENAMLRELENIRMTQVEHCETLTKGIEMFEAENAKLSTQLTNVTESMGRVEERCAKLRELLLEAYDTARGLALNDPLADVSWLADRMRELGIEAE